MTQNQNLDVRFRLLSGSGGNEAEALNLRETDSGLQAVGRPGVVTYMASGDRLLGTDRRGDRLYFFVEREGYAVNLGYSESGGEFSFVEETLLRCGEGVAGIVAYGDFMLLNTSGGIEYFRYEDGAYAHLGKGIEFPVLAFGTTESTVLKAGIPAVALKGEYAEWSGTLDAADARTVLRAVENAVDSLRRQAQSGFRRIHPAVMRVAVRLWDGTLLWSPDATVVGDAYAVPETLADVEQTASGKFRVCASGFEVPAWKPAMTLIDAGIGKWEKLVKAVEIYATGEQTVFGGSADLRCEQSQQGASRCFLRIRPDSSAVPAARKDLPVLAGMRLVAAISDIGAFVRKEVHAPGVSPVSDGAGGALTAQTYALDMPASGPVASWNPPVPRFAPGVLSVAGGRLFAGCLSYRLPDPPECRALWRTGGLRREVASVSVAVEVAMASGKAVVAKTSVVEAWSPALNELVCYPDSRATRLSVSVVAGGKTRKWTAGLSPSPCGRFAYAAAPGSGGFVLEESDAEPVPESSGTEHFSPDALLMAAGRNPFLWNRCANAVNRGVRAVVSSFSVGSSWVLGRYPAYLFAEEGIYLLSFNAKNECTAASLVSSRRVADSAKVAVAGKDIVFVDANGEFCRLSGSSVKPSGIVFSGVSAVGCSVCYEEVWIAGEREVAVVTRSGAFYRRGMKQVSLLSSDGECFVSDTEYVYSLERTEMPDAVPVELRTPAFSLRPGRRIRSVLWKLIADGVDVRFSVYGENGRSCHGELLSSLHVKGDLRAPLSHRLIVPPFRTYRLGLKGRLPASSLLGTGVSVET